MNSLFPIHINLTSVCNQSCPFCFASREMANPVNREMNMDHFRTILQLCRKSHILSASFLGGEPTLHTKFKEIMDASLQQFLKIHIFTNGIFSKKVKESVQSGGRKIELSFNVTTPGFLMKKEIRKLVLRNIREIIDTNPVYLVITDLFLNPEIPRKIIAKIDADILRKATIALGFILPVAGETNMISIDDFAKVGKGLCSFIKYLENEVGIKNIIFNNTGIKKCMFTDTERKFIIKRGLKIVGQCHSEHSWFAVTSAGEIESYNCYPLSTRERLVIQKNTNLIKIRNFFRDNRKSYEHTLILDKCRNCPFFGYKNGQCSGPCLGFRINALKKIKPIANISIQSIK